MVREVEWTQEALCDLSDIKSYIAVDSPGNAEAVVRAIERSAAGLLTFTHGHRVIPEFQDDERRETIVHRWRLMYRVLPDRIRIVGVIHGSRLLSGIDGRSFQEISQAEYTA